MFFGFLISSPDTGYEYFNELFRFLHDFRQTFMTFHQRHSLNEFKPPHGSRNSLRQTRIL